MEKEEKKADLEQLLNSLIEKGFRPFGRYDKLMGSGRFGSRQFVKFGIFPEEEFTLRELTSINSGLWQFVCENGMVEIDREICGVYSYHFDDVQVCLIRSALKDESELEDFLLQNIVIKDE